uniref:Uncharacterized protein n=1 Tax=Neisseria meningitidis alpha153 TaxID=663926 RepID=C6SFD8_NEIME|nr:hypothetical protein predicted by Glimmer/Critica [Neisseria meningitidis alpha153]
MFFNKKQMSSELVKVQTAFSYGCAFYSTFTMLSHR